MPDIKARGSLGGHKIEAPVVNPGDADGRVWLIEVGGSYTPLFVAVESYSAEDAINEFSDSKWGHLIHVAEDDMQDYPEDSRHYDDTGRVIDLDHVAIHGSDNGERRYGKDRRSPWPCTYVGEGLPDEGVDSLIYNDYIEWVESDPRRSADA